MMSFLKSILWKKSEKTTHELSVELQSSQQKIEDLEKETEALKVTLEEMTSCIQNITLVMHSLSQEVLTIVMAIKGTSYSAEPDVFSIGLIDEDDDNLLN